MRDINVKIPDVNINNKVALTRLAKVALPPKYKGEPSKLKEYITKLN